MSPSFSSSRLPTRNALSAGNSSAASNGYTTNIDLGGNARLHGSGKMAEPNGIERRKCDNLISYFTTQIHHLSKELEMEKRSRDTYLEKIAKALLCFEAKLKNDQKHIRQQLFEKDTQLNRLANEVISLREKFGLKDEEKIEINSVAQYCPNCRKQFYCLSSADVSIQVKRHGSTCRDDVDKGKQNGFHYINLMFFLNDFFSLQKIMHCQTLQVKMVWGKCFHRKYGEADDT